MNREDIREEFKKQTGEYVTCYPPSPGGYPTHEYVDWLEDRLIRAEQKKEEVKELALGTLKALADLRYIDGIVTRGTGKEILPEESTRQRILDYVKSLEQRAKDLQMLVNDRKELEEELAIRRFEGKTVSDMLGLQEATTIDEIIAALGRLKWDVNNATNDAYEKAAKECVAQGSYILATAIRSLIKGEK